MAIFQFLNPPGLTPSGFEIAKSSTVLRYHIIQIVTDAEVTTGIENYLIFLQSWKYPGG